MKLREMAAKLSEIVPKLSAVVPNSEPAPLDFAPPLSATGI